MKGQQITKDQLVKGLYIKLPLRWHEHPFLRSAFEIQSAEEVELIKKLPLDYVLYFPEKSPVKPQAASDLLRLNSNDPEPSREAVLDLSVKLHQEKQDHIKEMTLLRTKQAECAKRYQTSTALLRKGIEDFMRDPDRAIASLKDLSCAVSEIASEGPLSLNLIDKKLDGGDHFFHTMNVATLALMVAKFKGYSANEMEDLVTGAFVHDIGYFDLSKPFSVDGKPAKTLASTQKNKHPIHGAQMLSVFPNLSQNVINIVSNHHEYLDGSGFPNGLKGEEVDEMSQIVAIANMYDELCRPEANGRAYQPSSAIAILYKKMESKFRSDILQLFIKVIGVYPPGAVVMLSDDSVGMVLSNNAESLLKPNLVLYDPMVPRDQAPLIALQKTELSVKHVVKRSAIPQHIYDYTNRIKDLI